MNRYKVYSINNGFGAQRGTFATIDAAASRALAIAECEGVRADVRDALDTLVWQSIPFDVAQSERKRNAAVSIMRRAELASYRAF